MKRLYIDIQYRAIMYSVAKDVDIIEGYYRKNSDDLLNSEATIVVELASVRPSSLDFQETNDPSELLSQYTRWIVGLLKIEGGWTHRC